MWMVERIKFYIYGKACRLVDRKLTKSLLRLSDEWASKGYPIGHEVCTTGHFLFTIEGDKNLPVIVVRVIHKCSGTLTYQPLATCFLDNPPQEDFDRVQIIPWHTPSIRYRAAVGIDGLCKMGGSVCE